MTLTKQIRTSAIIAAAGSGTRMNSKTSKQFITLAGIPVLARTLLAFEGASEVDEVIIVTREDDITAVWDLVNKYEIKKVTDVIIGGDTRQESVMKALDCVKGDKVLIHDGARPFVTPEQINSVANALEDCDAAALGVPVKDTLKRADANGYIAETCDRSSLFSIQTPQGFKTELIKKAHKYAKESGTEVTDDCALCENLGICVKIIQGSASNIKITTPDDLEVAQGLLKNMESEYKMRVGFGYDVHKLVEGRPLIIGGVNIPYERGLLGHSDADVLLHAIMDALLGAAALGDIGKHFPDTDEKWRGADSTKLLERVGALLVENGAKIVNIDATIIAQKPKMAPYIEKMVKIVEETLNLPEGSVNIKATTTEKLGFCGRGEGIAAEAICGIEK
ncbi:MAG: 2-C-methyl-D-erythritol 2,4-cyclodiphosphate synthase [Clostridia bacterium]|nr:2-C-methyl-D-erythritol 2,4-cyclodiphosphate synthase [Clostridia bacterium]